MLSSVYLSPRMIQKTKNTVNKLMTFDSENEKQYTKRLVNREVVEQPKIVVEPVDLTPSERVCIKTLQTFTDAELDQLILLFRRHHVSNCVSPRSYWRIIGPVVPLLPYHPSCLTTLQQRMFSVFHVVKGPGLNLVSFLMSIAVLCDKSSFMTRAHLASSMFFLKNNEVDMEEICTLFSDSYKSESREKVLFTINVKDKKILGITLEMFIDGWCRFLRELGGIVSREVFETKLLGHPSSQVLLYPFGIYDYTLLE